MNTKEKLDLLAAAISQLGLLYRELNGDMPKLEFVGAGASANSEVKKMPEILLSHSPSRPEMSISKVMIYILNTATAALKNAAVLTKTVQGGTSGEDEFISTKSKSPFTAKLRRSVWQN